MIMNNLEIEEMKQYLKSIVDLETSVYQQEKIVNEAKKSLVKQEVQKKGVSLQPPTYPFKPVKKTFFYNKPNKPISFLKKNKKLIIILLIFLFFVILLSTLLLLYRVISDALFIGSSIILPYALVGFFVCMIWTIVNKKHYNKEVERYEINLKDYEKLKNTSEYNKDVYEAEYQKELDEYNLNLEMYKKDYSDYQLKLEEKKKQNEQEYQDALSIANRNYEIATEQYQKLCDTLDTTKSNLEKLYNTGIIFPKYRNFVAVCSMYEYFGSGRVDSLEGANGAYNLYESELRQNLIINSLEKISTNLEIIKSNQYILYTELKDSNERINNTISDISNSIRLSLNSIKRIEDMSEIIAESTYINAYCSKINAENSQIMSTMALLS